MRGPLLLAHSRALGRLEQLPRALDAVRLEGADDVRGNLVEVVGGQRQYGGPRAAEADAEQARVGARRHRRENVGEARHEDAAVALVEAVLHGEMHELGVDRVLAERGHQQRHALEVVDGVLARVGGGQHVARLCGADLERGDHADGADFRVERVAHRLGDVDGGQRRGQARVEAAGGLARLGQHLGERDLRALELGARELAQKRADKPAVHRGGDVVRVPLDHEAEVHEPAARQRELADGVADVDAGHHGSARRAEPAAERDVVVDVDVGADREDADVVGAQHVEGGAGDEVCVGLAGDVVGAEPAGGDRAVHAAGLELGVGPANRDVDGEEEVERDAEDVEPGADVGAGRGDLDLHAPHNSEGLVRLNGGAAAATPKRFWVTWAVQMCQIISPVTVGGGGGGGGS